MLNPWVRQMMGIKYLTKSEKKPQCQFGHVHCTYHYFLRQCRMLRSHFASWSFKERTPESCFMKQHKPLKVCSLCLVCLPPSLFFQCLKEAGKVFLCRNLFQLLQVLRRNILFLAFETKLLFKANQSSFARPINIRTITINNFNRLF